MMSYFRSLVIVLLAGMVLAAAPPSAPEIIPGIHNATPEAAQAMRQYWTMAANAPETVYLKMKGTALGHEATTEVWLGDGDIVAKVVVGDVVTVTGSINETSFKTVDGKPATLSKKEKIEQLVRAHPKMATKFLFGAAKRITLSHGHEFKKETDDLVLHGLSHGDVILQLYKNGTLAANLSSMGDSMMHASIFGDYRTIEGHPVPGEVQIWIVHVDGKGKWSLSAESSRLLTDMKLLKAEVNQPIPKGIFERSTWEKD